MRAQTVFSVVLAMALGLAAGCSDDSGNGTPDGGTSDGIVSGDGAPLTDGNPPPNEGGTTGDSGQACGFVVGDTLLGTDGENQDFVIGGETRSFIVKLVNVPSGYSQPLPIIFGLHGTGQYYNIPTKYYTPVSENRPFIYVVPKGSGPFEYPWDFTADPNQNKDIKIFDDLIQCLQAQFNVDMNHIHAFGFSWGGHWINYLMAHRGDVLASAAQISAGAAVSPMGSELENLISGYSPKAAQLIVWGGPSDTYGGYSFETFSMNTVANYRNQGYFVLQCVHANGHDITPPERFNKFIFEFFQDHPKGVTPEPYLSGPPTNNIFTKGTYLTWPSWCTAAP